MELFLAKVYQETITITVQWASSAFLPYIRIQVSDLSKGIITLMKNNHAFYTIPEIIVVSYTPGQPDTDPQRLRQKNADEYTQLPPSRYRAKMAFKEGNTTSLLIYYEYPHGHMVSFLLPLE